MRSIILYVALSAFALGVGLRSLYDISLAGVIFLLVMGIGVALIAGRGERTLTPARYLWLVPVTLLMLSLGILRFEVASWQFVSSVWDNQVGEEVTFTGTVVREPDYRERSVHLYVDVADERLLVTTDRYSSFFYGDEVRVVGELGQPSSFETDLGRTFNYPGYLQARDVAYTVQFAEVEVLSQGNGNPIIGWLLTFKHAFMGQLELMLPEPQVGLAEGLLLGVKRALGAELESAFRTTGIIHIVVLSGYNVMLVVAFVTYVLAFLAPGRTRLLFGLAAIAAFALTVGLSATVVRASIMAAMILIARATNRTYLVMRALMVAGAIMIVINPYLLVYDTGFQLSFLATMGLILISPKLEERLTLMPRSIGLREFLTATVATQIFVLPILLYQIGEFSVVAVIVNVLVLPMVPVAMLLTFITGMVSFISATAALPLVYLTYLSLSYIIAIAVWFAALPFASFVVPAFPFWVVILSYTAMALALWRLYGGRFRSVEMGDELAGWEIVEESDEMKAGVGSRSDPTPAKETPVFFR